MKKREVDVEVVDNSLCEGVHEHRFASDHNGTLTDESCDGPIPEEYMKRLEDCLGDAQAQVTVGADLTTSVDFGNKAGAFVSVKVSCDNSEDGINAALDIAREIAEKKVAENQGRMADLLAQAREMISEPPSKGPAVSRAAPASGPKRIAVSKPPDFRR